VGGELVGSGRRGRSAVLAATGLAPAAVLALWFVTVAITVSRAAAQGPEPPAGPAPAALASGADVARVELRSDVPLDHPEEVLALVTLVPGEPYDEREARRSLRNLHASGVAAEAEIWLQEEAAGELAVLVALWGNVMVRDVRLVGEDLGLRRETLLRDVEVKVAQPLVEDRVLRTVFRLQDRYRAEGFLEARVRVAVDVDEGSKRADVAFVIAPGTRAHIGAVTIEGDPGPFSHPQLVAALRARPGQEYRQGIVRDDAERLRRWLYDQGYRQAEVELLGEQHDPQRDVVDLSYRVTAGGRLTVVVEGADLASLRRRDLLPFLTDEGYDETVVLQAIDRIRRHYQERGHYRARVEQSERRQGEDVHLTITVVPGPVYTLAEVRFTGNESVPEGKLRELVTTREKRLFVAGSGRLVDEVLAADLDNVAAYYALSGWGKARVGPPEVIERGDELILTIPIVEGDRSRVVDLAIEGVAAIALERLREELPLRSGGPFHPRLLDEALDRIRARYEQLGYAQAQVSATTDWNEERTLVDVTVRVLEGPQQLAANLVVRGNQQTDADVIRMLAGIDAGEPLSRRRLLDVQRSLYQLGIFSRVDVALAPAGESIRERDVVVRVEEGRNRRVVYGFGYDSEEGPGGVLGYSHANLFGRAVHLQGDARASERTQRFRLLLKQPYWGGTWPGSVTYLLYQEAERRATFHVEQRGVQAELARGRGRVRYSLFADYRQVGLAPGDDELDLSELPLEEQRAFQDIKILSLVPRAVWDRRDDPIEPSRGSQAIAQVQYAFPAGSAAEEHFLELFGQYVHYFDLDELGVVAASVRGGAIEPLGNRPVSIAERFFAGGRTTHRAYERDRLGIPGTTLIEGTPIGGGGLLLVNVDYRFPIAGPLGGTVFADAGNVWPAWRDVDAAEAKLGVGVGLRYLSPIGPLRVEVGWKLDREPGEPGSAVLISFGNAF
jgi:outer membrane protein insertion porin family